MGYRSVVRVMTTLESFEEMQEIAFEIKERENIAEHMLLIPIPGSDPESVFDYYDAQEDYLCFGFDWIKWYDNYKDVSLFMEVLEVANERGVDWQFIRTGEDYDDVENFSSDNFYDNATTVMNITVDISY